MKVLFIGGNGNISWYCVQRALERGCEVWELNRAQTRNTRRAVQPEVKEIICDIRNVEEVKKALCGYEFDVICDFICFNEIHAKDAVDVFKDKTKQYVFISSEAVYKRLSSAIPFKESAEQYSPNEVLGYIGGKVLAEQVFKNAFETINFPVTIVRPAYTYDTIMPASLGHNCFTLAKRIINGEPMLVYGEGQNLCAPMHSSDFASAFVNILGNKDAVGNDYHITGADLITYNEMAEMVIEELGAVEKNIINIPYKDVLLLKSIKDLEMTKQQMWHYVFDNSKIKSLTPEWEQKISFREGIKLTVEWFKEKAVRQRFDERFDQEISDLYGVYWRR